MSERLTKFAQQLADEQIQFLRAENKRLRLTDAEREAVECGIQAIGLAPYDERTLAYADTLRGLLERTKAV